jgi:hypothetical protein
MAYKFEADYTVQGRHYAHPLVSWSAIFAGAAVAVALGVVFNFAGAAVGAASFNPFDFESQEDTMTAGAALYAVFAQLVAFQIGAFVAARSAQYPDHFGGLLTGLLVWATATVFAVVLAALAASGGGNEQLAAQIADTAGDVRASVDSGDLAEAEAAADAIATLMWVAAAALALGLAGAVAGGWLGAHHPKWDTRPRHDDRTIYRTTDLA